MAFATVNVGVGAAASPAEDGVSVTPDTVVLNAPVNEHGKVSFATVPSAGVTETLANGPAGAVFSNGVLSAGTAVPGDYKNVAVTAKDAAGATAVETFDAVVRPVYAPVPRLSGGHAVFIGTSRENVYFIQSGAASWDHFTIVGPGAINGHQGWVNGQLGLNAAVYGGLEYHHGYTVYYQPVTGQGQHHASARLALGLRVLRELAAPVTEQLVRSAPVNPDRGAAMSGLRAGARRIRASSQAQVTAFPLLGVVVPAEPDAHSWNQSSRTGPHRARYTVPADSGTGTGAVTRFHEKRPPVDGTATLVTGDPSAAGSASHTSIRPPACDAQATRKARLREPRRVKPVVAHPGGT